MNALTRLTVTIVTALGLVTTVRAQSAFERDWLAKRRLPISTATAGTVSVVTFLDWQCPACRTAERAYAPVFADLAQRFPGRLHVETRDYPLDTKCNPHVPINLHSAGCEAAVAVRLAREHGMAQAMIDWLFAKQESLTPGSVRDAAAAVGHVPDFLARYDDVMKAVARDVDDAHRFEVTSTPSYFVNGILARGNNGRLFSADEMRQAITIELQRQK
jgi:protein-disulfide isomerase